MFLIKITIVIMIAIILLMYFLIKINDKVRIQAYELFLKAEHKYMSGEGLEKFKYVIDNIYPYLPTTAKILISKDTLSEIVQGMFDEIKDLLDDGCRNDSVKGSKKDE